MTLLFEAVKLKKFDIRVLEKNLERGLVSSNEVQDHLESLPDDAENADWVCLDELAETDGDGHREEDDADPNASSSAFSNLQGRHAHGTPNGVTTLSGVGGVHPQVV